MGTRVSYSFIQLFTEWHNNRQGRQRGIGSEVLTKFLKAFVRRMRILLNNIKGKNVQK